MPKPLETFNLFNQFIIDCVFFPLVQYHDPYFDRIHCNDVPLCCVIARSSLFKPWDIAYNEADSIYKQFTDRIFQHNNKLLNAASSIRYSTQRPLKPF